MEINRYWITLKIKSPRFRGLRLLAMGNLAHNIPKWDFFNALSLQKMETSKKAPVSRGSRSFNQLIRFFLSKNGPHFWGPMINENTPTHLCKELLQYLLRLHRHLHPRRYSFFVPDELVPVLQTRQWWYRFPRLDQRSHLDPPIPFHLVFE